MRFILVRLSLRQGSDHCPVYVILNDKIDIDGVQVDLLDMMNPTEMFMFGHRQRDHSIKDCLPLSGKLIPEFDGRRSIRDMFSRKVSLTQSHQSSLNKDPGFSNTVSETLNSTKKPTRAGSTGSADASSIITCPTFRPSQLCKKRPITDHSSHRPLKRDKLSVMTSANTISKNQQSLSSFLTPKASPSSLRSLETIPRTMITSQANLDKLHSDLPPLAPAEMDRRYQTPYRRSQEAMTDSPPYDKLQPFTDSSNIGIFKSPTNSLSTSHKGNIEVEDRVHDPIEAKDSWSRVFAKPVFPRCEGHGEPCIRLLTKKSGLNCGRSFWMCQRPLGPTGSKEKNTQWRCQTFIWCSDWNSIRDFQ